MKITTILFDLDGTLLPMDEGEFTKGYFGMLSQKLAPYGYKPEELINAIWVGTKAMVMNDGSRLNSEVFWDTFEGIYGTQVREHMPYFDDFYVNEFKNICKYCGYTEKAREVIGLAKELGYRVVCATNPIFPSVATETRMGFAGLKPEDFELYTTYENSSHCKPNPDYYNEILEKIGCVPTECLMVGNDAREDMAATKLGMKGFLLTDCLINKDNIDISQFENGDFNRLLEYIRTLNN